MGAGEARGRGGGSHFNDISLALGLGIQKKVSSQSLLLWQAHGEGDAGGRWDSAAAAFSVAPRRACPSEGPGVKHKPA